MLLGVVECCRHEEVPSDPKESVRLCEQGGSPDGAGLCVAATGVGSHPSRQGGGWSAWQGWQEAQVQM